MADLSRDNLERLQQRDTQGDLTQDVPTDVTKEEDVSCPHLLLMPRWDAIEDMGKMDRVVGYRCDGCGRTLSHEEGGTAIEQGAKVMGG